MNTIGVVELNFKDKISPDLRIVFAIGIILLSYYLLIMGGHHYSIDGAITFQAARTLVADGSLTFQPPLRWGSQIIKTTMYGPGMTILYVPLVQVARFFDPDLMIMKFDPAKEYDGRLMENDLYLFCSVLNPLLVAFTGIVLFLMALEIGFSRASATAVSLVTGLASPLTAYARFDFSQPLITLILLITILLVLRADRESRLLFWIVAGMLICYGVLTRPDFVFFVPWIYLLAFLISKRWKSVSFWNRIRPLLLMTVPALLGAAVYFSLDTTRVDSMFQFGRVGFDIFLLPEGISGQLFSPGKGILFYFPLCCLAGFGFLQLWKIHRSAAIVFASIILTTIFIYSTWGGWWGGWSWGPRFLIPMVPFFSIYAVLWAATQWHKLSTRVIFVVLLAASWIANLNAAFFNFGSFYLRFSSKGSPDNPTVYFSFESSPILSGWDFSLNPQNYDLFWLRQISQGSLRSVLFVVLTTLLLTASAYWLRSLLMRSVEDLSVVKNDYAKTYS